MYQYHLLAQLAVTFAICRYANVVGYTLGLLDDPRKKAHGLHTAVTPLVGGLAVVLPWLFVVLLYTSSNIDTFGGQIQNLLSPILVYFIAGILVLGALDDRFHLSARSRLVVKIGAFAALVIFDQSFQMKFLYFPLLNYEIPLGFFSVIFTVLCLTALTNAVNMTDGRNGLVIGLVCIWLTALMLRLPSLAHPLIIALLAALIMVGWFNWRGHLFLGDAGSYALSGLTGLLAIWAHNQPYESGGLTSAQLACLFMIPALDMFRLIVVRTRRGVSCMSADNDHLHHRLDRFCGWNVGLLIYLSIVGFPIWIALSGAKFAALGVMLSIILYGVVWSVTKRSVQVHFS